MSSSDGQVAVKRYGVEQWKVKESAAHISNISEIEKSSVSDILTCTS